jgi:hypothetical protein
MKRKQQTIYAQRLEEIEIAAAGANAQSQFLHGLKENSDRQRVLIPVTFTLQGFMQVLCRTMGGVLSGFGPLSSPPLVPTMNELSLVLPLVY